MGLIFGTAGVPLSAKGEGTPAGIRRIKELGLECMEVQFVRGVRMSRESAGEVKRASLESGVALSAHAPYFINLNAREESKVKASKGRILSACRLGNAFKARDIVFHPAFYLKSSPSRAYRRVREGLSEVQEELVKENLNVTLRPETTGKKTQFGSLSELLALSSEIEGVLPCVDFSHLHARGRGGINTYEDFSSLLCAIEEKLGREALKRMHIHASGINYGKGGEKSHTRLHSSGFNYHAMLQALADFKAEGKLICESPALEVDALLLKERYKSMKV